MTVHFGWAENLHYRFVCLGPRASLMRCSTSFVAPCMFCVFKLEEAKRITGMGFDMIKKNDIIGIDHASGQQSVARVTSVTSKKINAWVVNGAYDMSFDRETGLTEDYGMMARIAFSGPITQEVEELILRIEKEMSSIRAQPNLGAYEQCMALFPKGRLDPVWQLMGIRHDETLNAQKPVSNSNGEPASPDDECEMRLGM